MPPTDLHLTHNAERLMKISSYMMKLGMFSSAFQTLSLADFYFELARRKSLVLEVQNFSNMISDL